MPGLSPFGGNDDATFDDDDEFVPDHLPEPGEFLAGHELLTDDAHVAVHGTARELFEERGVYDMTFGYNLARLNLDTRHPGAGFRYAEEVGERNVLRAEFTPTTAFCPQTHTLTVGAFRAWNGLSDRHDYDLVRIRAAPMHQESDAVNEQLRSLEQEYRETGTVPDGAGEADDGAADASDAPF
ncbi:MULTISPECIES: hypothetical protein [Halolamina]|uniref:DUF7998 domain-containing protein n=1 Tax=Halolamina pelagica TaxID=699431 RepID=A0A1I5MUY2_9EURY|nr:MULTISPECIES: hypothetical protein [Halolamina]NHX36168.1 hypothetical protein [Halolamina sp. R1-12]SFP13290.1 hypothetical protein SAMN05216277_101414 [Halolamina pelagica]